ncbi:MAG TPA: hypothetical protein VG186_02965 [Solirubrobacteraceae bacterium]|jgi:hypothetical protein|nr:hypothetical protein [Solirubrobacteraceae bacterium]
MVGLLAGMRRTCGLAGAAIAAGCLAACGGGASAGAASAGHAKAKTSTGPTAASTPAATQTTAPPPPPPPPFAHLTSSALSSGTTGFVPVASWRGHTAAWIARTAGGVALLSFDQRVLELHLHSGTSDAGASGWRFGPSVAGAERRHLLAAFNGGFRFSVGAGGFSSYGRVAVPLRTGLGSIVTYSDGTTNVGSWGSEVPAPGAHVVSVRQNLTPLVDNGSAAPNLDCLSCWGATLGGVVDPARSALGITANRRLIWAGGEHLTTSALAGALLGAGVVRAVELDINPAWVAGYLYGHRGGHGPLAPVPVVPGQSGISGEYLSPWSRDFFTVVTR